MINENGFATRKGVTGASPYLESATTQIHRERAARKKKQQVRQRKRMRLIARRHGIRMENERRAMDETMKSASMWKRMQWGFVKAWRKLFLTG